MTHLFVTPPAEVPGRGRDLHYATCFLSFDLRAVLADAGLADIYPMRLRRFRDFAQQLDRQQAISWTSCIHFYIAGDLELACERPGGDACRAGIVFLRCPFSRR